MTSVVHVPNVRNYWNPQIGLETIWNCMSVNKFEEIRRFLHFNHNSQLDPTNENRDRTTNN